MTELQPGMEAVTWANVNNASEVSSISDDAIPNAAICLPMAPNYLLPF